VLVFAAAYYIHQKVRMTRFACVVAAGGGFMMYATAIGAWLNQYATQVTLVSFLAVLVGICVIVADVKGKRKGADKPALIAFFLVPVFLVSFLAALPVVVQQAGAGLQKVSSNMQVPGR
jgi:succinate dehydrogenase hydrophobic anchor subunit